MLWLDPPPPSRWRLVGGYALLILLVLTCGYVAFVIWHAVKDAEVTELPATSAGPRAASQAAYPDSAVGNATPPRAAGTCTPGAAALSLCNPTTSDARP